MKEAVYKFEVTKFNEHSRSAFFLEKLSNTVHLGLNELLGSFLKVR